MDPVFTQSSQARVFHAFGEQMTLLLDGAQTGGQFTSFVEVTNPGGGPPPHWHDREDEWFYILEGRMSFLMNGEWIEAGAGDTVFAPRGKVHTFKNNTATPTRMLIHAAPSGFEQFFIEAAAEFAKPGGPDIPAAIAIAEKYGIHFVQP